MPSVSDRVAAQYQRHVYPPPLQDLAAPEARAKTERADPKYFAAHLFPEGLPRQNLRILSAGCGSSQAAHLAYNNPDCTVTGIDLSEASLAHQRHLAERHGLKNLRVERRDILDLPGQSERFDLIVCTGVIHHMQSPADGLRALAAVLSPRGALYAMVYAYARRAGVYLLQDVFRRLHVAQDEAGIAFVRRTLKELPAQHYARWFLPPAIDAIPDAELVDIFLHVQDRAFSVPEVLALVDGAGLAFQGWSDNGMYFADAHINAGSELGLRLAGARAEDEWSVVDALLLHNMTHSFVARHPEPGAPWRVDFEDKAWLGYKPVRHPSLTALPDGRFRRGAFEFALSAPEQALLQAANGQSTISAIVAAGDRSADRTARREQARAFYRAMWRRGHLFFRTA